MADGLFGLAGLFFGGEFTPPPQPEPGPTPTPTPPSATSVFITVRAVRCVHATPAMAARVNRVFLV